jgi:hypothetical protein
MRNSLRLVFSLLIVVAAGVMPGVAAAQGVPHNDVFLGYTRTGSNTFYAGSGALSGVDGAVFIHLSPFAHVTPLVGIEGDLSYFGLGGSASSPHTTTFMAGPRLSVGLGSFRIFAHGLAGGEHSANSAGAAPISDTSFVYALGVGVDVPLMPLFAWRVQADRINAPSVSPSSGTEARFSTGLVFRF